MTKGKTNVLPVGERGGYFSRAAMGVKAQGMSQGCRAVAEMG